MANYEVYEQVDIGLAEHPYTVTVSRNSLRGHEWLQACAPSSQVLIVTNHTVAPFYLKYLQDAFNNKQCDVVILKDGEQYKNQASLFAVYDALIQRRYHRDATLITLGGGVISDLAGFAAATYQRGIRLVHIPTTLLAQIDAAIGGKTAINHPAGKNMIGSFYQPSAVLIDVATLVTLPEREFHAGIAEMIKYALLVGGDFFYHLESVLQDGLTPNHPQLPSLIAACCRIKAQFVVDDEQEHSRRALLNLGHTFAHALETSTNYLQWLHGEAVAIGLYCAAILSQKLGLLDVLVVEKIKNLLLLAKLPFQIPPTIDLVQLHDLMYLDKKVKNNCLRFVVMNKPGDCYLVEQVTKNCLMNTLIAAVEGE